MKAKELEEQVKSLTAINRNHQARLAEVQREHNKILAALNMAHTNLCHVIGTARGIVGCRVIDCDCVVCAAFVEAGVRITQAGVERDG
jgi:hypothetical protein